MVPEGEGETMKVRTTWWIAAATLAVSMAITACGSTPSIPVQGVVSPVTGASVTSPFDTDIQTASVRVCSLAGGPIDVDVHLVDLYPRTQIGINVISADRTEEAGPLRFPGYPILSPDEVTAQDLHATSNRPLLPSECAVVQIGTSAFLSDPGPPFTYSISW